MLQKKNKLLLMIMQHLDIIIIITLGYPAIFNFDLQKLNNLKMKKNIME